MRQIAGLFPGYATTVYTLATLTKCPAPRPRAPHPLFPPPPPPRPPGPPMNAIGLPKGGRPDPPPPPPPPPPIMPIIIGFIMGMPPGTPPFELPPIRIGAPAIGKDCGFCGRPALLSRRLFSRAPIAMPPRMPPRCGRASRGGGSAERKPARLATLKLLTMRPQQKCYAQSPLGRVLKGFPLADDAIVMVALLKLTSLWEAKMRRYTS